MLRGAALTFQSAGSIHLVLNLITFWIVIHCCVLTFCQSDQSTPLLVLAADTPALIAGCCWFPEHMPFFDISAHCHQSYRLTDGTDAVHFHASCKTTCPACGDRCSHPASLSGMCGLLSSSTTTLPACTTFLLDTRCLTTLPLLSLVLRRVRLFSPCFWFARHSLRQMSWAWQRAPTSRWTTFQA